MSNSEKYQTTIRYYNCRTKQNQKYISIELPVDSTLDINSVVEVTITPIERQFVSSDSNSCDTKRKTPGAIMRQMNKGDSATFDISQWKTLRVVASRIKGLYGTVYSVTRDRLHPENVIVTRIS